MRAKGDIARLTTAMYLSGVPRAMRPTGALWHSARQKAERVAIDQFKTNFQGFVEDEDDGRRVATVSTESAIDTGGAA